MIRQFKGLSAALLMSAGLLLACNEAPDASADNTTATASSTPVSGGQSMVQDDVSQRNVVQVAASSADHSTLVKAVQTAELVDALSNAGPFTVFAPTNAAFDKLPAGTVDNLLKPASKEDLKNILEYHVYVGVIKTEYLQDGQTLGQANGDNIKIAVKDGKVVINETATIVTSIPAANGLIHVIDGVLLPPSKK